MTFKRNNELVEKIKNQIENGNIDERDVISLIREYEQVTFKEYKDKDDFECNVIERFVNDFGFPTIEIANRMADAHPTLQQAFFNLILHYVMAMAEKQHMDGRNERAVMLAKKMWQTVKDEGFCPMV